jgi:major membrane immunogen (membrane-anchored lipoprotein)
MTKLPKIWPALLVSLLLLGACGDGNGTTPPPVDPSLDWDEDNWDEKDWA